VLVFSGAIFSPGGACYLLTRVPRVLSPPYTLAPHGVVIRALAIGISEFAVFFPSIFFAQLDFEKNPRLQKQDIGSRFPPNQKSKLALWWRVFPLPKGKSHFFFFSGSLIQLPPPHFFFTISLRRPDKFFLPPLVCCGGFALAVVFF